MARAKELAKLPGLGKTIAERIVKYRQANGLFKGIGKATLDKRRDAATVG